MKILQKVSPQRGPSQVWTHGPRAVRQRCRPCSLNTSFQFNLRACETIVSMVTKTRSDFKRKMLFRFCCDERKSANAICLIKIKRPVFLCHPLLVEPHQQTGCPCLALLGALPVMFFLPTVTEYCVYFPPPPFLVDGVFLTIRTVLVLKMARVSVMVSACTNSVWELNAQVHSVFFLLLPLCDVIQRAYP